MRTTQLYVCALRAKQETSRSSVEVHLRRQFDLEFNYSRSMPLRWDTFSFGIGVDLVSLMHPALHSGKR